MTAAFRRNLLVLMVLVVAIRWLDAGLARLFQVQDAPVLLAYQRALPQGREQALNAALAVAGTSPTILTTDLRWHELYGGLLALLTGCLTLAWLAWRRRVSWLLLLLLPLATTALAWSGLYKLFRLGIYEVLGPRTVPVSLPWLFVVQGLAGVGVFLLLAALAFRIAPPRQSEAAG